MKRVVGGVVAVALLTMGVAACTSDSEPTTTDVSTKSVAVEPDEIVRHEANPGTPIAFGIEVPEGAVQVGPPIRQRRIDVGEVIDEPGDRAGNFANDRASEGDDPDPATRDPEVPLPPDFTTALLRVDGETTEVLKSMLSQLSETLPDSDIDPEKWQKYCVVEDGFYTGCRLEVSGLTEDDERIGVELTVDPGNPKTKVAPAGSLLRPVVTLTVEQHTPTPEDETEENESPDNGESPEVPSDARAKELQNAADAREAAENAKQRAARKRDARRDKNNSEQGRNRSGKGSGDKRSDRQSRRGEPKWPTMKRERPAKPGNWILTPKWKVHPNTKVILSSTNPKVAMLALKSGADADKIARRYVSKFADEATTPKIDVVEDRNERSITYTPRNDGSGPAVAVTAVATGRGNYIELLFAPDEDASSDKSPAKRDKAKRTTPRTGND